MNISAKATKIQFITYPVRRTAYFNFCSGRILKGLGLEGPGLARPWGLRPWIWPRRSRSCKVLRDKALILASKVQVLQGLEGNSLDFGLKNLALTALILTLLTSLQIFRCDLTRKAGKCFVWNDPDIADSCQ